MLYLYFYFPYTEKHPGFRVEKAPVIPLYHVGLDGAPEYRTETSTGGAVVRMWDFFSPKNQAPLKMWKDYDYFFYIYR